MRSAPTTGAAEPAGSWAERRALALVVRALVVAAPIGASWLATRMLQHTYWRPAGGFGFAIWAAQVLVVGSAVVLLAGRVARRFLPLATLLNLSLVFPDQAPSRFRVALRSGTIRNLEEQVADVRAHGFGATDAEAAQRVIELVTALGRHERLTRGHTERVRAYTDLIATELGLPTADRNRLRWASFLHDIGKLAVPAEILNKAGKPTDDEWAILQSHPAVGGELVEPLAGWLGEWRLAASQHHERWDGTGYPHRLAGLDISLAGRIVAVADAYDVITSARAYKKPMTAAAARAELVRCSGTQFDPTIVRTFLAVSLGDRGQRAGALGWLAEFARTIATSAAQTTSAAGSVVAASAVASATAVATLTAPPAAPPTDTVTAAKVASAVVPRDWARATTTEAGRPDRVDRVVTPEAAGTGSAVTTGATGVSVTTTRAAGAAAVLAAGAPTTTRPDASSTPTVASSGAGDTPPTTASPTPPSTTASRRPTTTVGAAAPNATDDNATIAAGATITVAVLANDTDPDGDLDPTTLIITVAPSKGTAVVTDGAIVYTADTTPGTANLRYQICDHGGRCTTARLQIKRA